MKETAITLTTAEPNQVLAIDGPHRIDITGAFGGGTVTPYSYTNTAGRGSQYKLDGQGYSTAAEDYYRSESPRTEFVLSGSSGATVQVIATPIVAPVRSPDNSTRSATLGANGWEVPPL